MDGIVAFIVGTLIGVAIHSGSLTLTNSQNCQKSFRYGFFYVKFLFFNVV